MTVADSQLNPPQEPAHTALLLPLSRKRRLFSQIMNTMTLALALLALLPLLAILFEIMRQGLPNLSWEVFVSLPQPVGFAEESSGFANAILGTVIMVGIATLLSVPLGIMTAIFLSELSSNQTVTNCVRFIANVMSGIPSIIVGVFAYGVVVLATHQFSALAGGVALAVVMLPIIILTTEQALRLVPESVRFAAAALGGNRRQTTFRVVISSALPSILTGILLAIARAAGETAPLLFTALFSADWPEGLLQPAPSMSVLIYNYASSPYIEQNQLAWTASLVLVALVLLTSIISRLVTRRPFKEP